jgi:hypothetical protein
MKSSNALDWAASSHLWTLKVARIPDKEKRQGPDPRQRWVSCAMKTRFEG